MQAELLLIRLKTPANIGACFRLAMQYGITKIYMYKCPKAGRTNTTQTQRHIPVVDIDNLDFVFNYPYGTYLLETDGTDITIPVACQTLNDKFLIAVANESHGATTAERKLFGRTLTIPAPNTIVNDHLISYNVSHAVAIGLFLFEYNHYLVNGR